MMQRNARLLFVCLLCTFITGAMPFTTLKTSSWRARERLQGNELSAFQASSSLGYRDRDISEEQISCQEMQRTSSIRESSSADSYLSGVSMPLIRAIWFNQASILLFSTAVFVGTTLLSDGHVGLDSLNWSGMSGLRSVFDSNPLFVSLVEGVLAAFPIVALGNALETSHAREASLVNFSTNNMVITLFGRRKSLCDPDATSSILVMALSAAIALSTGVSEELVFRAYIPAGLEGTFHSASWALVGQALLYALAHVSPKSSAGENKVVGGLQFVNGIWYGIVYVLTGGNILPCIIAHTLYDMHVLCETWSVINHQMDYTQDAFVRRLDDREEQAIQIIQKQAGPSLTTDTLNFARRFFYAFDSEHKGSLSLPDLQRAVTYAFLNDEIVPHPENVEEAFHLALEKRNPSATDPSGRLQVSEFIRVLFALKSNGVIAI